MAPPQLPTAGGSRPRSVLVKSDSSQRSRSRLPTPVEGESDQPTPPPTKSEKPHNPRDDGETNIQVVLRCRRRSDREIQENSPIIVATAGARSTELTIQTASASNSLGLVSVTSPRKYPFDVVFGPEADQAMIYQDVVSPMLDEITKGYNCTLFAYGQTGTGKTYVPFFLPCLRLTLCAARTLDTLCRAILSQRRWATRQRMPA